jgi:hypothetical protein
VTGVPLPEQPPSNTSIHPQSRGLPHVVGTVLYSSLISSGFSKRLLNHPLVSVMLHHPRLVDRAISFPRVVCTLLQHPSAEYTRFFLGLCTLRVLATHCMRHFIRLIPSDHHPLSYPITSACYSAYAHQSSFSHPFQANCNKPPPAPAHPTQPSAQTGFDTPQH